MSSKSKTRIVHNVDDYADRDTEIQCLGISSFNPPSTINVRRDGRPSKLRERLREVGWTGSAQTQEQRIGQQQRQLTGHTGPSSSARLPNNGPKAGHDEVRFVPNVGTPSSSSTLSRPHRPRNESQKRKGTHTPTPHPHRAKTSSVISISDDDLDDIQVLSGPELKKAKVEYSKRGGPSQVVRTTSEGKRGRVRQQPSRPPSPLPPYEDQYIDLNDEDLWKEVPVKAGKYERLDENAVAGPSTLVSLVESTPVRRTRRQPNMSFPFPVLGSPRSEYSNSLVCNMLRHAVDFRRPRNNLGRNLIGMSTPRGRLDVELDLQGLKHHHAFNLCPGSINRIAQRGNWIAVSGGCIGGGHDTPDGQDVVDNYNADGSLVTYNYRREKYPLRVHEGHRLLKRRVPSPEIPESHRVPRGGGQRPPRIPETYGASRDVYKYYTINDVKFDPNSTAFVSSGCDRRVRVCDIGIDPLDHQPCYNKNSILMTCEGVPHELVFSPESTGLNALAVGERDAVIFSHPISDANISCRIHITPPRSSHRFNVGAMAWGTGPTKGLLFASSEPILSDENVANHFVGYHKAVDVRALGKIIFAFDASEAGDSMVLDPSGDSLILTTREEASRSILRLYDVARQDGRARVKMHLDPYTSTIEGEVHDAAFSPDGVYLALGRQDNQCHVYDSRFLERGPLFRYKHRGPIKTAPGHKPSGIPKLVWREAHGLSRLGLVTGGSDGCVRLWDPLKNDEDEHNGSVLVELPSDIASFSFGDRFKGEHHLIVGDCSGGVTIFNRFVDDVWKC